METKVKICLGYFNTVHRETKRFVLAFEGFDLDVVYSDACGVYIDDNRNILVNKGQTTWEDQMPAEDDITHYFFLDSDVSASGPEILKQLLKHDKPIVSGAYVARVNTNCYTAGYFDKCLGDINTISGLVPRQQTGLIKLDWVGGGALLIKREVFEHKDVKYPWFGRERLSFIDSQGRKHAAVTGEDVSFCMKAKQAGYDIWLDADAKFTHHLDRGSLGAMQLTVQDIENPKFVESLSTLLSVRTLLIKDAWTLKGVFKVVLEELKKAGELKQDIFKKYPALITTENGLVDDSKLDVTSKAQYQKDLAELFSIKFDIPLDNPVKIAEDTKGICAMDCMNLEKIITI